LGTSSTDSSKLKLTYGYGTTNNNGNLLSQGIQVGAAVINQSYTYDVLNRLLTAGETSGGTAWSQTYGYDRYGNRWVSVNTGVTLSTLTPTASTFFSATTNRITNCTFDLAGNLTLDSTSRIFTYDAENRQVTYNGGQGTVSYSYDGDGRRVKKVESGTTTVFVYDAAGQLAADYSSATVTGGTLVTSYLTADHLGSTRLVTDGTGVEKRRTDYLPFGEEIQTSLGGRASITGYGTASNLRQKFTQKERDNESNLDYFGARYMSGAQGRFTSPDPLLNSGRPWMPQSWNRYAYTLNNPLRFTDPTGLYEFGSCSGTDNECSSLKKQFKDSLDYLKQARNSYGKKTREYQRLNAAWNAYGKEGDKGVTVNFGDLDKGVAARTTPNGDLKTFTVTFDPAKMSKGDQTSKAGQWMAIDVGHEGTHVADLGRTFSGGASQLSDFSTEYRGYETSAFVFKGLFTPSLSAGQGSTFGGPADRPLSYGGFTIWNTSWREADKRALQSRDVGITNAVQAIKGYPETKPHNPWGD